MAALGAPPAAAAAAAEETVIKEESDDEKEKKVYIRVWRCVDQELGHDWYELDLEEGGGGVKYPNPIGQRAVLPSFTREGSTGMALDSKSFYILGGISSGSGGDIYAKNYERRGLRNFADVFYCDARQPNGGKWRKLTCMNAPRCMPSAFGHKGKIYVFGGARAYVPGQFGEVFDPNNNTWTLLTDPPPPFREWIVRECRRMVLDSSKHRVLVTSCDSRSLYAYDLLRDSWSCLSSDFGRWYDAAMVMDDVLYGVIDGRRPHCLFAYDLVNRKRLTIDWSPETAFSEVLRDQTHHPEWSAILPLGKGKMCLASDLYYPPSTGSGISIYFVKLRVQRVSADKLLVTVGATLCFRIYGDARIVEFLAL